MKKALFLILLFALTSCAHHKAINSHHELKKLSKGEHRSLENIRRNSWRNPVATLEFFEIGPHMSVVEVSPGGGWYTEILAPYLRDKGQLTLAIFSDETDSDYRKKMNISLKEKIQNNKKVYGDIEFSTFDLPTHPGPIAAANSVDRVVTFRNVHSYLRAKKGKEAFEIFFQALKPGGILGVVQHRAKANRAKDMSGESGYVREDAVIELVESAGFEFVGKSEMNANYLDTADHPEGVWTLPPSLRLKEKSRSKYLAIGESDRMTLKFRKPE